MRGYNDNLEQNKMTKRYVSVEMRENEGVFKEFNLVRSHHESRKRDAISNFTTSPFLHEFLQFTQTSDPISSSIILSLQ